MLLFIVYNIIMLCNGYGWQLIEQDGL